MAYVCKSSRTLSEPGRKLFSVSRQKKDTANAADRLRKYLAEITLLGQPFIKDEDITVEKLLKKAGAKVTMFARYEVGAGIEKKQDDFVGEVMAQVKAQEKH